MFWASLSLASTQKRLLISKRITKPQPNGNSRFPFPLTKFWYSSKFPLFTDGTATCTKICPCPWMKQTKHFICLSSRTNTTILISTNAFPIHCYRLINDDTNGKTLISTSFIIVAIMFLLRFRTIAKQWKFITSTLYAAE